MAEERPIFKKSNVTIIMDDVHRSDVIEESLLADLHIFVAADVNSIKMKSRGIEKYSAVAPK